MGLISSRLACIGDLLKVILLDLSVPVTHERGHNGRAAVGRHQRPQVFKLQCPLVALNYHAAMNVHSYMIVNQAHYHNVQPDKSTVHV